MGWTPLRSLALLCALALVLTACGDSKPPLTTTATFPTPLSTLPPLPAGWPTTLELGLIDPPGDAAALRSTARFGFRYQYLAGGVNTGDGWQTWNPGTDLVGDYIRESAANDVIPVFSYYMLRQSKPGSSAADEAKADFDNLQNLATMTAYWQDVKRFFQSAGTTKSLAVLHVEPDLWGYVEQRSKDEDASTVPAKVAATGLPELGKLPDSGVGVAQAFLRLRDLYAPNVVLAYHLSVWGTGTAIAAADPPDARVEALAHQAAGFYESLDADFDLTFAEFSDRDAAFNQIVNHDRGISWWDEADFARNLRFLSTFVAETNKRVVMWQVPLGNTTMRAMDNSKGHYQDNRVEWLLDAASPTHLQAYRDAGVIAFLFGGGAEGTTCACDAMKDGVTDPRPIGANTAASLSADDDGGYFRLKAAAYYAAGPFSLTNSSAGE